MKRDKEEKLTTLRLLEELANKLDIEIQYVSLIPQYGEGGLIRLLDKHKFLVEKDLSAKAKIELLVSNLKLLDLKDVYIPPGLQAFFDENSR